MTLDDASRLFLLAGFMLIVVAYSIRAKQEHVLKDELAQARGDTVDDAGAV